MKFAAVLIFIVLCLGCVSNDVKHQIIQEKTALLSVPYEQCDDVNPSAYVQFVYQEQGILKYANTDTTCENFRDLPSQSMMGEEITITFFEGKPVQIRRGSGKIYDAAISLHNSNFFTSGINSAQPPSNLPMIVNGEVVLDECRKLVNSNEYDTCIAIQAASRRDESLCLELIESKDKCIEWLNTIETLYEGQI